MDIRLVRGFQISVIVGLAIGLWMNSWSLVLVCVVSGIVVYVASQKIESLTGDGYTENDTNYDADGMYIDDGDIYGDIYGDIDPLDEDNSGDGASNNIRQLEEDQQCNSGKINLAQNIRVPLYKEKDWKFVKPWFQMGATQQYMYRPTQQRTVQPLGVREKFVKFWAKDANAFATKDMYTIPRSGECPTRIEPSI
jgi:hypothetical protein